MTQTYMQNLWDDAVADRLDPVGRLVYRSNLLGQDWRITNTGGGNTSAKLMEKDPMTGQTVEVLWVKGSGGDLRTAKRELFASLYQDRLIALQALYGTMTPRGPKTPAEDAMVDMYRHCTFNLNPRASSIDTPLHSFVPYRHVDHTHPVACIALATANNGPALTREVYGDDVIWVDWQRPGFELGLILQDVCRAHPKARGVMLGGHGLINWSDDDKACYLLSLELIDKAAAFLAKRDNVQDVFGGARFKPMGDADRVALLAGLLPWLRGRLAQANRMIATVEASPEVLDFVNSVAGPRLAELGTSCPDHFLRTKIKPLYIDWDPHAESPGDLEKKLEAGIAAYQNDYAAYYNACKRQDSPAMRGGSPTVVLIPGLGMIAWGKSKSESRVTAEFYKCAVEVMRGAEAVDSYTALPRQEAFDIEYWALEEAKLKRMPPEQELSRRIAVVFGAGSGIGKESAGRLAAEGAVVVAVDLQQEAADQTAREILKRVGAGIGVAGTGISGCGDAVGLSADVTDRAAVAAALRQVVLAYGGLDIVVCTAGLYVAPDAHGRITDGAWAKTFAVNTMGPNIVAEEAAGIWRGQGLAGSMVVTTSVNAVVAKRGSIAYDASKAAADHIIRELAIELAPLVRVNGVAPATVVAGSAMFPRDRVIASLIKYEIAWSEGETTEVLRDKLAAFYSRRTLTRKAITPADQSEAIFLLASDRLSRTTGQIVNVDGGLAEAFRR
jgi:rhamnulose-1-phosphate aldolase/alcohol dehydrogenase